MLYTIPDYYKEFHCIAGDCEDTCCAGWQIVVDEKARYKYKKVKGTFRKRMRCSVNWKQSVFRQDKEKRCAFLNDENLCDMYTALGAESLCRTCRLYPRHIEEFENVREITLSVSCPEVARILMNRKETVHFLEAEREGEETNEEYDPFLYSQLLDARDTMLAILQNRRLTIWVRAKLILGMAHDIQIRVKRQEFFACGDVITKYQKESAIKFVEEDLNRVKKEEHFAFAKRMFYVLEQMELLTEDWYVLREETKQRLYTHKDAQKWEHMSAEFTDWIENQGESWEIQKEQLLVYFISTYFCGAAYDEHAYSKVQMAVASVVLLEELLKARWLRNEKYVDTEDVIELVYRYSREIEHSDENLKKMEKLVRQNWTR